MLTGALRYFETIIVKYRLSSIPTAPCRRPPHLYIPEVRRSIFTSTKPPSTSSVYQAMRWDAGAVIGDRIYSTLTTSTRLTSSSSIPDPTSTISVGLASLQPAVSIQNDASTSSIVINITNDGGSTGRGILIGILSAFGSAGVAVLVLAIFFFFKYTNRGRIILDRIGRPGEYDDEQAFVKEEAEALETMDELQKAEYLRAKGRHTLGPLF